MNRRTTSWGQLVVLLGAAVVIGLWGLLLFVGMAGWADGLGQL